MFVFDLSIEKLVDPRESANMGTERDYLFNVCNGFKILVFSVFITEIIAALEEDNMLTINVAAEPVPDLQRWNTYSPDDVRCYCNLPKCVLTGYMCKSEEGGCFSEVVNTSQQGIPSNVYKARHGCLELLQNKNQRSECRNITNGKASIRAHPRSSLLCCFQDMCNHMDSPETQTMLNGTHFGSNEGPSQSTMNNHHEPNMSASPGYNSNEVWFKAAIIAVPICGTVILFVLIVLAVKILRTDSLHTSSKLGGPYVAGIDRKSNRDHFDHIHHSAAVSMKKVPLLMHHHHHDLITGACTNPSSEDMMKHTSVPLLVQNETGISHSYHNKNEANAKFNTGQGHEYNLAINKDRENTSPLMGLQKPTNTTSSNNIYRNVNLSVTSAPVSLQQHTTDKLYDKQALSAVVSWGAPSPSSSPV